MLTNQSLEQSKEQPLAPSEQPAANPRRRGAGRPFEKGQSGNPYGRAGKPATNDPVSEPAEEVGDGAPQILKDLRWAYRNRGSNCKGTVQQEDFRKACKDDPLDYADRLMKHEREFRLATKGQGEVRPSDAALPADESLDRLIEQAEAWLQAHGVAASKI